MKKCPNCGTVNAVDEAWDQAACWKCGRPIATQSAAAPTPAPTSSPLTNPVPVRREVTPDLPIENEKADEIRGVGCIKSRYRAELYSTVSLIFGIPSIFLGWTVIVPIVLLMVGNEFFDPHFDLLESY